MMPSITRFRMNLFIAGLGAMLMLLCSWTVMPAFAQDETPRKAVRKGTIHTINNLVVEKLGVHSFYAKGAWYKFSAYTKFLDASGATTPRSTIPVGSVVNITYVTEKDPTELYPFTFEDKVILKIQIVSAASE